MNKNNSNIINIVETFNRKIKNNEDLMIRVSSALKNIGINIDIDRVFGLTETQKLFKSIFELEPELDEEIKSLDDIDINDIIIDEDIEKIKELEKLEKIKDSKFST